jgi:hypothetical protein
MTSTDLVKYSDFCHLLPGGIPRRRLESMAKQKDFPNFIRMSSHSEPLWNADAVMAWIKAKLAPVMEDGHD